MATRPLGGLTALLGPRQLAHPLLPLRRPPRPLEPLQGGLSLREARGPFRARLSFPSDGRAAPGPGGWPHPRGGAPRGRGQPENTPKQSCPPRTAPQPPARPIQPSPHVAPRPGPAGRPARLTFLGRFHLLLGPAGALVHLHGGCGGHTCWRLCRHGHRAELPSPPGCGVCPRPGSQTGNGGSACGAWVGESEPGGRAGTAPCLPSLGLGPTGPGSRGMCRQRGAQQPPAGSPRALGRSASCRKGRPPGPNKGWVRIPANSGSSPPPLSLKGPLWDTGTHGLPPGKTGQVPGADPGRGGGDPCDR